MKKQNRLGSRLLVGLMFLFLYAPILLLIIFSFNQGDSSAVWQGFSLHWYASLFKNRLIMESVYVTLLVSLLAIRFLLAYIRKHDFTVFGWYRIALGLLVLGYFYLLK